MLQRHPDRFRVVALTAQRNVDGLLQQCLAHRPPFAAMADPQAAQRLRDRLRALDAPTEVLAGAAGLQQVAALPESCLLYTSRCV